jgi:hypothetical protein
VIIPETPRESRFEPKAFVSWSEAIAFSRSNYGYSAAASRAGKELVSAANAASVKTNALRVKRLNIPLSFLPKIYIGLSYCA